MIEAPLFTAPDVGASTWGAPVAECEWGRSVSDSDPDYWAVPVDAGRSGAGQVDGSEAGNGSTYWDSLPDAPVVAATSAMSAAGEGLLAQLASVRGVLAAVPEQLVGASSTDLAALVAEACAVVAAAEAARAALVLDADARGVIASSDNPRVDKFVEQACRDAGAPVSTKAALTLKDIAVACEGHDVAPLREAVSSGRVSVDTAAVAARFYRKIKAAIGPGNWEPVLVTIIDAVAGGATGRELEAMAELIIGQYAEPGTLDEDHDAKYAQRDMTSFRRDRHGMLTATLRLDPVSEAVVTAALTALSVPAPGADGSRDERTPGQRRADALVSLAGIATRFDDDTAGTGAKAKIYVTISHDALSNELHATDRVVGVTEHGQVLTPAEVRMLACDAGIVPIVLGGRSEVLDVGREERFVTPAQRAALVVRDGGCSYPGCDAPPTWCDGHHLVEWNKRGPTDLLNLAMLCRHHHRETHMKGHVGTATRHGVTWTRADGTPLGNTPRPERLRG